MLAPVPMVRVRIQVPQREGAAATHAIARLGLLHLIDIAHGRSDVMPSGTEQQLAEHLALRNRIRRIADRLEDGRVDRLLSLLRQVGAKTYISGPSAKEYLAGSEARWTSRKRQTSSSPKTLSTW